LSVGTSARTGSANSRSSSSGSEIGCCIVLIASTSAQLRTKPPNTASSTFIRTFGDDGPSGTFKVMGVSSSRGLKFSSAAAPARAIAVARVGSVATPLISRRSRSLTWPASSSSSSTGVAPGPRMRVIEGMTAPCV
jgi:hypothetical protein